MSSSESQQHTFPAVPPSLSAGDHEMRDYYAGQDEPRPTTNQSPYLTPYLGLQARLSQVWINRWTILLLLVLVRVLIACAGLNTNLASARREAQSACTSVETRGSDLASMPHYMAQGVNALTADGVEKAVNGLMSMVSLSITAVEEIVLFIINLLTSTYECLITFAITGSLHGAINIMLAADAFLNKTTKAIGDGMADKVSNFESLFNKFLSELNSVPQIFGSDTPQPKLQLHDQIHELKQLQLPSGLLHDLKQLNKSIPTFHQVHDFTDGLIKLPFEKLKGLVNEEMTKYKFDRNLLPVPERQRLTFCSDNNGINDFFDGLVTTEIMAKKIFIGVIITLAVLACIPVAWYEIRRWRTMRERAELVGQQAFDSMDVVYIASRPHTAAVGIKIADRFQSVRSRTLVRWAVAYATSTPALFVLALGIAGLFSCLCQYALLRAIQKEVPELTDEISDFAATVMHSLNNASEQWAIGANQAINHTNKDINDNLFGWVQTSTNAVNDTLSGFVHEMMHGINDVFGGTILEDPVKEVINCLILLKVRGIEDALTWVHDHAHIDIPHLPKDAFTIGGALGAAHGQSNDSFLSNPGSTAKDELTGIVDRIVQFLAEGIHQEAIIAACLVIIYGFIALVGLARSVILMFMHSKGRAEGGQSYADDPTTTGNRGQDYPRPMSVAPPYEATTRAAPYTITPRPFPAASSSAAHRADDEDEEIKKVGSHQVGGAVTQPRKLHASTHAALGAASPGDEKNPADFPIEWQRR